MVRIPGRLRSCGPWPNAGCVTTGRFRYSDALDAKDIDWLSTKVRNDDRSPVPFWLPDEAFDLNGDSGIDVVDHRIWVKDLAKTWFGDANLDGQFALEDLTQVLTAGKYEMQDYASWSEGDWNGDGVFDTGDLVKALEDGGYEMGRRPDVPAVPEPGAALLLLAAIGLSSWRRRR